VVAAAGADGVDALGTDTGVRRLTARLEGSLLPCTQLSEISFISMCVEQAQNAMGWVPVAADLPIKWTSRLPQEPPKRTFECPSC
jgi:hypothetical protein